MAAAQLVCVAIEREVHRTEEARSPFHDVGRVRVFITGSRPAPTKNVALEMCVFDIEQQEKGWHVELTDHHLEPQFRDLVEPYKPLILAHHSKYDFQLSIWKNRGSQLNAPNYHDGFSHHFEKVQLL
ncbi:hypothetical protein G195_004410 [Phytophthora kernoviae 00238/432]|uniref:Uncharacterized protein n=1 Tax=Phytophthora kernoviae 00238/432 TaxID=1284355 RepID=A0A8J4SFH1_9STRA|nr:hypothetical protein G195_004410 [Phytophthora kernoviae 00238/432]